MSDTTKTNPRGASGSNETNPKADKFSRILEAALEVFAIKGFETARISDIARRAGIGDGTVYLYFKSKDDILISLFEVRLEEINKRLASQLDTCANAQEKVEAIIDFHLRLALEEPNFAVLVSNELRQSSKFMKDYTKEQLMEYIGQWESSFEEGRSTGLFRGNMSCGIIKHALFGALDHVVRVWINHPGRRIEALEELAVQLKALLFMGIVTDESPAISG